MEVRRFLFVVLISLLLVLLTVGLAQAQGQIGAGTALADITPAAVQATLGSTFTYQGQLIQGGAPVDDKCDFRFTLYDAATSGSPVGPVEEKVWVRVIGGLFTVSDLDFGASAFVGQQRWLQVEVRCPPTIGSYTIVGDRQELTATPYALYAIAAGSAPWLGLTGVPTGFADGVDNDTTYTAGAGLTLTGGAFAANTAYLQRRVTGVCAAGSSIRAVNDDGSVTCETDDMGWSLTGNAGTTPGTHFLGTSDNWPLELKVNGQRALRIAPDATSPNLIGGSSANDLTYGFWGITIAGGGGAGANCGSGSRPCRNFVGGSYGTVSGGKANTAGSAYTTVGGGDSNTAGGSYNSGGTVGGGYGNTASGSYATVSGGSSNTANEVGAAVGGGDSNTASGYYATVSGGSSNTASSSNSFAAGYRAKATHPGSFVWADTTDADFYSAAANQFAIRAAGGVKVVKGRSTFASTSAALQVEQASTTGQAVYATSPGTGQQGAAAYAEATSTTGGIAVWAKAQGTDSTMVLEQSAGAGDFVRFFQSSPSDLRFRVTASGEVWADGAFHSGGADFAELLPAETGLTPGDVLVIGLDGMLARSRQPYASAVAGVYSTKPGLVGGTEGSGDAGKAPLAIVGVVPTKASAENGAIRPGDLLTTSTTPGHAMRCQGVERCFGRTIGKALEGLDAGTGAIKVLVMLQ